MPTYIVRRDKPVLVAIEVEAASVADAIRAAVEVWTEDARDVGAYKVERQSKGGNDVRL